MDNETTAISWADLFTNGSLIDLDVSTWDGLVRLLPKDLGVESTDEVKAALTFGHERLVPKEALQFIRGATGLARTAIDECTIPFKLVPGSKFLPVGAREGLLKHLDKLQVEFQNHVNEFIADYNRIRAEHRPVLLDALEQASGNRDVAATALARIEAAYPTEQQLREKFAFSWKVYSIAGPRDGSDSNEGNMIREEIGAMVSRLREQLTEKVREILDLVGRGGKITERTYKSALKVCDRIDALNIFADTGLRAACTAVRNAIESARMAGDAGGGALQMGLGNVSTELEGSREAAIENAARMITGQSERRFGL